MDFLSAFSLTNWILILLAAFIIGLSKAGLKGIDMMNVTIMAIVFGGKASTGIVLPLLCAADILAVIYYHRHAEWPQFWKLIPWMIIGILIGVYVGKDLDEIIFRRVMAVIIVLTVIIMIVLEFRKNITISYWQPLWDWLLDLLLCWATLPVPFLIFTSWQCAC
jgi:uncharacterized membrane protein YfcA